MINNITFKGLIFKMLTDYAWTYASLFIYFFKKIHL